jgi:hypothetical protein
MSSITEPPKKTAEKKSAYVLLALFPPAPQEFEFLHSFFVVCFLFCGAGD